MHKAQNITHLGNPLGPLHRLLGGSKTTPAPANSFASCSEWENRQQKWGLVIISMECPQLFQQLLGEFHGIHVCPHNKIHDDLWCVH